MMILRRLVEFEYSRYSSSVPGLSRKGIQIALVYLVVLIAGAMYLFRNYNTPEVLFALGVAVSWGLMMTIPMIDVMTLIAQRQREWWLSFPQPRLTLVFAKVIGLVRVGLRVVILILVGCLIYYELAIAFGRMNPQPLGQLLSLVGANLLLAGSFIPVAIMLGLTISTMYNGWQRWLLIPYIIIIPSPYALCGILMSLKVSEFRYLSPTHMLLYTLGIVVIGWPISYLLMRAIAGIGMRNMADFRLRMKSTASQRNVDDTKHDMKRLFAKRSGFVALYLLERSRYRYYGSIKAVQIIMYSLLAIIGVRAYFSSGNRIATLEELQVIYMFPVMGATIYTMNRSNFDQKGISWWLGYPRPRIQLVLAQLAGLGVTVMKVIAAISVTVWVGIAVGLMTGHCKWQDLSEYLAWFTYALLLYTTVLIFALGILQSTYYFMRSTVLTSLFILPLYLLAVLQLFIIKQFFYPTNYEFAAPIVPAWNTLWIFMAVGLPIAALGVYLGAKRIHMSLNIRDQALFKKK